MGEETAPALRPYLDALHAWGAGRGHPALRPVAPVHPSDPRFYEDALRAVGGWPDKEMRRVVAAAILCEALRWGALGRIADAYEGLAL